VEVKPQPFNPKSGADTIPTKRFANLILEQAIWGKADKIVLNLGEEFEITAVIGDKEDKFAPATAKLYEVTIRLLLAATEIQYWAKGEISTPFETINPISKWMLASKDLSHRVELKRIRPTNT
jgi:hypothetical protein